MRRLHVPGSNMTLLLSLWNVSFMIITCYHEKSGLFPWKNRLQSAQLLLLYSSTTTATLKRSYVSASGPTYTCSFYTHKKKISDHELFGSKNISHGNTAVGSISTRFGETKNLRKTYLVSREGSASLTERRWTPAPGSPIPAARRPLEEDNRREGVHWAQASGRWQAHKHHKISVISLEVEGVLHTEYCGCSSQVARVVAAVRWLPCKAE